MLQSICRFSRFRAPVVRCPPIRWFSKEVYTLVVPPMTDTIYEGTISNWVKQPGDRIEVDELVVVVATEKTSIDVRSPTAGQLLEHIAKADQVVLVGDPLGKIEVGGAGSTKPAAAPTTAAPTASKAPSVAVSPAAPSPAPVKSAPAKPAPSAPAISVVVPGSRQERRVPMTRMRQTVAKRLKESQNVNASLTTFNEIDMTNAIAIRNKYKDEFEKKHNQKLSFMSFFVRAASSALADFPMVNAVISPAGTEVIYRDFQDISVAVSTPTGLVVPVLRNCESMTFADVEKGIANMAKKARDGHISMEDMAGGTFTISNGGTFGSLMGTPIINPPQSGILGMHGTFNRPIVVDGKVEVRPMMYVALTYDHRIVDGREAG